MARRGVSRFPRTGARRQVSWGIGTGGTTSQSITATGKTIIGSGIALAAEQKVTIVRTRGYLNCGLVGATAALDGFTGAFGIGIVSDEAFTVGVTAIPGPLTDAFWPGWLVHQFISVRSVNIMAVANNAIQDAGAFIQRDIDSKAMRKFDVGETMVAMLEVTELGSAATMQVTWDSRVLLKLS